jgi:hypothetical protein
MSGWSKSCVVWLLGVKSSEMNVTDEIIGDIKEQKAGLVYLGNNIDGKKFEEIRVMVIGDSSECCPYQLISLC